MPEGALVIDVELVACTVESDDVDMLEVEGGGASEMSPVFVAMA